MNDNYRSDADLFWYQLNEIVVEYEPLNKFVVIVKTIAELSYIITQQTACSLF